MPEDSDARDQLLARFERRFDAGSTVFRDGDAADKAYLVQTGRVRLFKQVGALERSLRVVRAGELFGESALLKSGSQRGATAIALDDVRALGLSSAELGELLQLAPATGARLVEQLVLRLRDAEDQIEILMVRDAQSKIVIALLKLAQHRAGPDGRPQGLQVTPLELSAHVGLDVDSVKRIVLGLREAGYLRVQDERLEIPDIDALRELYGLLGVKDQLRGGLREPSRQRATR